MKNCLMIMLLSLLALSGAAQTNRIYIDDFEIYPDSTVTVPVVFANESRARGLQYNMTLPEGLTIEEYELTDYSKDLTMSMTLRRIQGNYYGVFIYPSQKITYPADTTAVIMTLTFGAKSDFTGGEVIVLNGRSATMNNQTFVVDGDTVAVTVPAASLIGIPMDQNPVKDEFFNLQGTPIPSADSVPVAIHVVTLADGRLDSRKECVRY